MLESKSLKVSTRSEQKNIDLMQDFGWQLKSSQEVNTANSHLERRGDAIYSVTNKEKYVKLVFERDTNHKNYDTIKELELKYHTIMDNPPKEERVLISGIIAVIGLLFYIVPGALYLVWKIRKRKKCKDAYKAACAEWNVAAKQAMEYRNKAISLLR